MKRFAVLALAFAFVGLPLSAWATLGEETENEILHMEELHTGRYDTAKVHFAIAEMTLKQFIDYPDIANWTDNTVTVRVADPTLGKIMISHRNHIWEGGPILIIMQYPAATYEVKPDEQQAFKKFANHIANWWRKSIGPSGSIVPLESRESVVPVDPSKGLFSPSRAVYSRSCTLEFKVTSDKRFNYNNLVRALRELYGSPTGVAVAFKNYPTQRLRAYPFKVEDVTIFEKR